jgi:hypothetical protein
MEIKPNFTSEPPSEFYLRIHYLCCVLRKINENRNQFVGSFRVRLLPLMIRCNPCVIKCSYAMDIFNLFLLVAMSFFSTQCSYANFSLNYNVHRSILLKGTPVDNRQNSRNSHRRHLSLVDIIYQLPHVLTVIRIATFFLSFWRTHGPNCTHMCIHIIHLDHCYASTQEYYYT